MVYYLLTITIFFGIYCIYGWGINLQFGFTGILNFTYITFVAIGAYFAGVSALQPPSGGIGGQYILGWQLPFPFPPVIGGIAAALFAIFVGSVGLKRLRSDYLAIVTVSVGQIVWTLIGNVTPIFNGWDGIAGVPQPLNSIFQLPYNQYQWVFVVITIIFAVIGYWVINRLTDSPFGRVLRAIREDEDVAAALGKNVYRFKMTAFVIGSMYAGVGGALTIAYIGAFNPSGFTTLETFIVWAAMLVGGAGNNRGVILGAFVVPVFFNEITRFIPPIPSNPMLIDSLRGMAIGLLLMLVARYRPQGILPERKKLFRTPSSIQGVGADEGRVLSN